MAVNSLAMQWEPLRSVAASTIASAYGLGTYAGIGTQLNYPCKIMKVVNTTDVDIMISNDGINAKDYVPSGGFFLYDITTNKSETGGYFALAQGERLYAYGNPTIGSVYFISIYASND